MTFDIEYVGPDYNGGYQLGFEDSRETKIRLNVDAGSFSKTLTNIFKDFPNDFRDEVHNLMVDYALAYFEENPIPEDERERFFELIGRIAEHNYEDE